MLLALTSTARVELIVAGSLLVWLILAGVVADYGRSRGHPFFPLFVCSLFLSFPVVLLAIAVVPRGKRD
jgi:hypothetical protein